MFRIFGSTESSKSGLEEGSNKNCTEPSTFGLEKIAPLGELEIFSRSNKKIIKKLHMFF